MAAADDTFSVRIEPSGLEFKAVGGRTLLRAANLAGISLPSSCRNGTCRTCICTLVKGEIRYAVEWPGLSREEKQEGYILPCVAIAQSDLVLNVPHARTMPPPKKPD